MMMTSPAKEGFWLSEQQKRLWLQQGASRAFRAQCAVWLYGNLRHDDFQEASRNVVQRHEILHTTFERLPDSAVPIQIIEDAAAFPYEVVDLSGLGSREQDDRIDTLICESAELVFDFQKRSWPRSSLIKLAKEKHLLLVCLPSLVADAQSLGNLVREIGNSYVAVQRGDVLPDVQTHYVDFAEWQRELLEEDRIKEKLNDYRLKIAGSPLSSVTLPLEDRTNILDDFDPLSLRLDLTPEIVSEADAVAAEYGTSVHVLLLACWHTLLGRLAQQSDVVVHDLYPGRIIEPLREALGLFSRYISTRSTFDRELKFSEVLAAVGKGVDANLELQEYLATESSATDVAGESVTAIGFDYEEWPALKLSEDVSVELHYQYSCIDRFKLRLSVLRSERGFSCVFHYDPNVYSTKDIERLSLRFRQLLKSVFQNPETPVGKLAILDDCECRQLVVEWNQTRSEYLREKTIHELFEQQVEKTPGTRAIVFGNEQLTYAELNGRANQLAHYLIELGVKPEARVATYLERGLDWLIAVLGILKAGGAYVPLDTRQPKERGSFIFNDTRAEILLSQEKLKEQLPEHQAGIVCLDTARELLLQPTTNPVSGVVSGNLAYVIYTSGSTGRPKGTMVQHASVINLAWALKAAVYDGMDSGLRIGLNAPLSFDSSVKQIIQLFYGHTLYILPDDIRPDGGETLAYIAERELDVVDCTPSQLKLMLAAGLAEKRVAGSPMMLLGGEAIDEAMWAELAQLDHAKYFNVYGPTECTVDSSVCLITREQVTPTIGRPIANTQLYLLDKWLEPCPLGVAGELYIGGDGLARGYLNRADLTAERFIPDPFGEAGGRLYRTGDVVKYLSDGNVQFVGRVDHQVKVRGHRIELGEVEASLSSHVEVGQCVVAAVEGAGGHRQLVAYVVAAEAVADRGNGGSDYDAELKKAWRQHLRERLPEYMLPSIYMLIDRMPLTPNGKVDRQRLPSSLQDIGPADGESADAQTPAERTLAQIWCEVLGLRRVGVSENFFELGGDSILSIQVVARANKAGLKITPRQLFQHQSIVELAAVAGSAQPSELVEQGVVTGDVLLTPIQRWFFEQRLPEQHHWNQSVTVRVRHDAKPEWMEQAIANLLTHHDALRLKFKEEGGEWRQFSPAQETSRVFERHDLSQLDPSERVKALETYSAAAHASLNLNDGPLMRAVLFEMGGDEAQRLLLVIHHLVVDGVSWRILLEDLQSLYRQLSAGERVQLPAKTTSFQEWSRRLAAYAQSEAVSQEESYWLGVRGKESGRLPIDQEGGENLEGTARTIAVELSEGETRALLQEVLKAYHAQINEVLLAGVSRSLLRWAGGSRLLVEMEGHGREEIGAEVDVSRTVGWFTTLFPVLLEVDAEQEVGQAVKQVKEQLRSLPQRGIGYGLLKYISRSEQWRGAEPEAEVSFNYLGQFDGTLEENSIFTVAEESSGRSRSELGRRQHLLSLNGSVAGGRLTMGWTYSSAVHSEATIRRVAGWFIDDLRNLIRDSQSVRSNTYSPSDFPSVKLNQRQLDAVLKKLSKES